MLIFWVLLTMAIAFTLIETILRWRFGLGRPLLYIADPAIGYLPAPHQRTRRNGQRIVINGYGMRGPEITPEPTGARLLLLGDSVANGGWWTDQARIISARLGQQLGLEVLNASANSWGPRNQWAYVERFGLFGAKGVIVLLNTDDLFATAPSGLRVGRDRNYPDRLPWCAIHEVYQRYGRKGPPLPELAALDQEGGDRIAKNLTALGQIHTLTQTQGAQLYLAMTPLKREVKPEQPRDYERVARDRLTTFAQTQGIPYLDFLPVFNADPDPHRLYHDHIHLNDLGNGVVTDGLANLWRGQTAAG